MSWWSLAWKEAKRRPVRSALTVVGVAIAVAALFILLELQRSYGAGIRVELDRLGAHVLVVPKGCPYDAASIALHGANWPCYLNARYLDEVRSTRGVAAAAPVLMSAFYDSAGHQTVYVGIDTNMLSLKPGWRIDGRFPAESDDVLIGADVARRTGWKVGHTVELPKLHPGTARVCGILAPAGSADDTFIFLRLNEAQVRLRHAGEITHILVRLSDPAMLDQVVQDLRGCNAGLYMNVVPLAHLFRTIQGLLSSTRVLLSCLGIVALLLAAAGVSNTLLMAVAERTREIGVLRALGASRLQVFTLYWMQTMVLSATGAVCGIGCAFLGSRLVEVWLRGRLPFAPRATLLHFDPALVAGCVALALVLGSFSGWLPAWRASTLSPTEAMRRRGDRL